MQKSRSWGCCVVAGLILNASAIAGADSQYQFTILHSFDNSGFQPFSGLTADLHGNLYGTTSVSNPGGGSVYELSAGSLNFSNILTFNGAGSPGNPGPGELALQNGNLFGATYNGGVDNCGTVYEISGASHSMSVVASLNGTDGQIPYQVVVDSQGDIFGAANAGGPGYTPHSGTGDGTLFEIAVGTHTVNPIVIFNHTNGANPAALRIDSQGDIFGVTFSGGTYNDGTLFEVPAGSHTLQTLVNFQGINQSAPFDLILAPGGQIYGVCNGAYLGATQAPGSLFQYDTKTKALSILHTFDTTDGGSPNGLVIGSDGNIYGATEFGGGAGHIGTIFEYNFDNSSLSTLASFNGTNGQDPSGELYEDAQGDFIGTAAFAGPTDSGEIFELTPVPEPGVTMIVCVGALSLLARRGKRQSCR